MAQASEDIERGRIASQEEARECPPNTAFDERLATVGLASDLFYRWAGNREKHEYHVNLGNLHRVMLHGLQKELVDEVAEINRKATVDKAQRDKIRILLRDYGESGCFSSFQKKEDFSAFPFRSELRCCFCLLISNSLRHTGLGNNGLVRIR